MAQGTTINQRLAFDGLEDVIKRLQVLGETGAKSIEQIRAATGETNASLARLSGIVNELQGVARNLKAVGDSGTHAAAGVTHLGHAVGGLNFEHTTQHLSLLLRGLDVLDSRSIEIGQSLAHLGGVFTGVVGAIGTAVIGFGALALAAAQSTREIGNQAAILGISRDEFEGLKFAGEAVGVSNENLSRGLDRFFVSVGRAREGAQKLAEEFAITGEKNRIAVAKLSLSVDEQNLTLDRNANKQKNLADAITAAALAAQKAKDAFEQHSHSVEHAQIAAEKAQIAYDELKDKFNTTGLSARDARKAQLDLTSAQLAAKEAQEGVAAAEKKRKEDLLELGKAYEKIKQAEAAFALARKEAAVEAKKAALALDEEKLKVNELAHSAEQAKNVFEKLNVNIATPDNIAVLERVMEQLNAIPDAARRDALAIDLFGRSFRTLMPFLQQSTEELRKRVKEGEHFAFTATDNEVKASVKLATAYYKMTTALEGLKNAFGNIIGGNFVGFFDKIAHAIADNTDSIRKFFQDVSDSMGRWSAAVQTVLSPALDALIIVLRSVGILLKFIKDSFDDVATTINKFTGLKLTGEDIIVGLISMRLAIGLAGVALTRLYVLIGSVAAGLTSAVVRIATFAAALLGIGPASATGLIPLLAAFGPVGWFALAVIAATALAITFGSSWSDAFAGFMRGLDEVVAGLKLLLVVLREAAYGLGLAKTGAKALFQPGGLFDPNPPPPAAKPAPASGEAPPGETYDQRFSRENPKLEHHQGGGWIGGSGSGDHVPLMGEPGEFMVNKRSAGVFGGLLQAINSARGFALGGIVDSLNSVNPSPLVVGTGGAAARPAGDDRALFHLTIGDTTFKGLSAPRKTGDEMLEFARRSSAVSMGKKQSWYGS